MVDCNRFLLCGGYTDDRMNMSVSCFNTRFVYRCNPDAAIVEGAMPMHDMLFRHDCNARNGNAKFFWGWMSPDSIPVGLNSKFEAHDPNRLWCFKKLLGIPNPGRIRSKFPTAHIQAKSITTL